MNARFHDIWSEDLNKIIKTNPTILDQWVVAIACCHQYAEGICGQNFYASIIFKEMNYETGVGCGFAQKGEWKRYLDPTWRRAVTKKKIKGHPTAYGEVGAHYRIVKSVKFKELVKQYRDGTWNFARDVHPFGYYWNYSTPQAVDGRKHMAAPKEPTSPTF